MKLRCTKCGREYPLESFIQRCEICNEPLELELLKGEIREGKLSGGVIGIFILLSLRLNTA